MSAFKEIKSKPELTIILAAVDDYSTVFEAIRSIELQSAAEKLELLIVIESLKSFSAPDDFQTRHPMSMVSFLKITACQNKTAWNKSSTESTRTSGQ